MLTLRCFEVSFGDPGLPVRARISDVSSGSAIFVANVVMAEDQAGTYFGTYSFDNLKAYLIQPRVYTDGTFATVDPAYAAASSAINPLAAPAAQAVSADLTGEVESLGDIEGLE